MSCQWVYGGKNQDKVIECRRPEDADDVELSEANMGRKKRLEEKLEKARLREARMRERLGWNVTEFPEQPDLDDGKYRLPDSAEENVTQNLVGLLINNILINQPKLIKKPKIIIFLKKID